MKFRGKFKADGAFIAEGGENFDAEILAEKLVEISIEVLPTVNSNEMQTAEKISIVQGIPIEVALDALALYGKCKKTDTAQEL